MKTTPITHLEIQLETLRNNRDVAQAEGNHTRAEYLNSEIVSTKRAIRILTIFRMFL